MSRNKHFEVYDDPMVRRAARVARHLESLASDLYVHGADVITQIERESERVVLHLEGDSWRRTSFLGPKEWEMLCEDEELLAIIQEHQKREDDEPALFCALDSKSSTPVS